MAQFILMFGLNSNKEAAVRSAAAAIGAAAVVVPRRDYSQKLGALAQVQGFPRDKTVYNGPDFPAEMLVFSGMNSAQVDAFLAEYKKQGVPAIGLKAIVTAHNVFWTAEALFKELLKEHMSMTNPVSPVFSKI